MTNYERLKDFAQKRLNDSCENDDGTYAAWYWVGYIDGLNALYKKWTEEK